MSFSENTLKAYDNHSIAMLLWLPEVDPVGVVQIIHGMAEHVERYDAFARFLNSHGYIVAGHDHRGHGKSATGTYGMFTEEDGWQSVVNDCNTVSKFLRKTYQELPLFAVAHSMGSFLLRDLIACEKTDFSGVILSGSTDGEKFTASFLKTLATTEIKKKGPDHPSKALDRLAFGTYNIPYSQPFSWLSRDKEQVKRYVNDPLCGFLCTSSFFRDLATGLLNISSEKSFEEVPKDLPILIYSGDRDPVGGINAMLVKKVWRKYQKAGIKDLTLHINPGGRHESLNETNRDEVFATFLDWIRARNITLGK